MVGFSTARCDHCGTAVSSTAATCAFMSLRVVDGPKDAAGHFSLPSFVRMEILPAWGFKYLQRKMVRNFAVTES